MDAFRVFRGPIQYKLEIRNYDEALKDQGITNTNKLYVELGTPLKSGDVVIRFVLFDPNAEIQVNELFTVPLSGKLTVAEAKKEVVKLFNERQTDEKTKFTGIPDFNIGKPENLRLRDINLNPVTPKYIYMDSELVKNMARNPISSCEIAIQKLPEGTTETKKSRDTIVFFLQEFNEENYTLGKRFEFETNDNETLTSFRDRIAAYAHIPQIGLVSGDSWIGHNRLDIPHLRWNTPPSHDEDGVAVHLDTSRVRSLNIQDGDLVLFKDMSVIPMPLNEAEKKEIREIDNKKRRNFLFSSGRGSKKSGMASEGRESKLVIKEKNVNLDDEDDRK